MKTLTTICGTFLIAISLVDNGMSMSNNPSKFFTYLLLINFIWIAIVEQILFKPTK